MRYKGKQFFLSSNGKNVNPLINEIFKYITLRYCFICYAVFISASHLLGSLPFYQFPVQSLFLRHNPVLPRIISTVPYVACARGGPCVARRRLQTRMWCYPGMQFNLITRYPIPGPGPAPVTTRDWGVELRGSSVSSTLQRRL